MDISIIMPTKNGSKTIERCLDAIQAQTTTKTFEIIAVDSSSTDNTVEILENHGCKIISIQPSEFSHGHSRNLGAQKATGNILIFVNQDTLPKDDKWLEKLVAPIDGQNVAAFSRQIPYPETPIAEKIFLNKVYSDKPRTVGKESLGRRGLDASVLYSTVSAAIKHDVFNQFKFSDQIIMGEDQEIAVRLVKAGYTIRYVPESVVIHSHSYGISRVFKRYFDAGWGLYSIPDLRGFNLGRMILDECNLLCETASASSKEGTKAWLFSIAYTISKSLGFAIGTKANFLPKPIQNILSHTIELKRQ